jgi:integrase
VYRDRDQWRVQWTDSTGRRRSRTFPGREEARRFEMELELGIADQVDTKRERLTFEQFAARWLKDHGSELAGSQVRKAEARLKLHLNPAFGSLPLDSLRARHLLDLRSALLRKKAHGKKHVLSRKTANLVIAQAKQILAAAVEREHVAANHWAKVKLLRLPQRDFSYWRPAERDQFAERAMPLDPAFTRLVVVACHTGLRRGELAALTRRDLDFDRGAIRVRGSYCFETKTAKSTKGGEVADVEMNSAAKAALGPARFLAADALVFDRGLFVEARRRLAELAAEADVPAIRFHDLRHTFASCMAMAGADLLTIQRQLRHKSYAMTLRYAHLHPDHLRGATEVLCRQVSTPAAREAVEMAKSRGPRGT